MNRVRAHCCVCDNEGGKPMPHLIRRVIAAGGAFPLLHENLRWEQVSHTLVHERTCMPILARFVKRHPLVRARECFHCKKPGGVSAIGLFLDAARLRVVKGFKPGTLPCLHKHICLDHVKSEIRVMRREFEAGRLV